MKITFINVGYGEAILIQYTGKSHQNNVFTMLIDGGSNEYAEFDGFPYRIRAVDYLMSKSIKHINLMVSTHIHEDHICGLLQVARNITVDNMWCNYHIPGCLIKSRVNLKLAESESQRKFISAVNDYNELTEILLSQGTIINEIRGMHERIEIFQGLYVDILGPETNVSEELRQRMEELYTTDNDAERKKAAAMLDAWMNVTSIMMRIHAGTNRILLPGDANNAGYRHITEKPHLLEAEIFKLGHHGQIDSVSEEIIKKIKPKIIVSCASSDRRYESANPKIFETINKSLVLQKPVYLFSDNVNLPIYSQIINEHSALVINIDDIHGEVTWVYE